MIIRWTTIHTHQRGLLFRKGEFQRLLTPGRHWIFDPLLRIRVHKMSTRQAWLEHPDLEVITRSGALDGEALVLDLKDHERALVKVDGRYQAVLGPGLTALWTSFHEVDAEVIDAREVRFDHPDLAAIRAVYGAETWLGLSEIEPSHLGLLFVDGQLEAELQPGLHAFWNRQGQVRVQTVDLREQSIDVAGQEIMTADKVTLRLNALVAFRVVQPQVAVTRVDDYRQTLYRRAQLALRAVVGGRELDALLADKENVATELVELLRPEMAELGVEVLRLGIRDVILPGDMKEILNRVTEARKAAEAALITRREETAAMRSQANTARILEANPTLMKLKELEVLEKVADKANLTVLMGEGSLSERMVKLL